MENSVEITLYFADWCGHCVDFKPEWKKFKENISECQDKYKKIRINATEYEHETLSREGGGKINNMEIDGYPTIKIRLSHKNKGEKEYNYDKYGKRDAQSMTDFLMRLCDEMGKA